MGLFEDNCWRRKNQATSTGNICTCDSLLKTSIYCEQAFRDCLMRQLVGLSANFSLLSHWNVWQYISFLAIVQLVRKKKINRTPTQQNLLTFVKMKTLGGIASNSVEAPNTYSLLDHNASWKGLMQFLYHVLSLKRAPGQALPDILPAASLLANKRSGWK